MTLVVFSVTMCTGDAARTDTVGTHERSAENRFCGVNPDTEGMGAEVMIRMRTLGVGLAGAFAMSALCAGVFAGTASAGASPAYSLKGLPEIGRCVFVGHKLGYWKSPWCKHSSGPRNGSYEWYPGPGPKPDFKVNLTDPVFETTGHAFVAIKCGFGDGEGEYTGEKSLKMTKVILDECKNPAVSGEAAYCQKSFGNPGEIEVTELVGEVNFVKKKKRDVGLALSGTITFECEGASELTNKSLGDGITREVTGAVIGQITPVDGMVSGFSVHEVLKNGAQNPEQYEGGEKTVLKMISTPFASTSKTEAPALFTTAPFGFSVHNEEPLEIKAKCQGPRC